MSVNALYLSNLPVGITKAQLLRQLGQHPQLVDFFKTPHEEGTLDAQVYDGETSQVAVVKGFSCDFDKVSLAFRGVGLWSKATHGKHQYNIVVKPDTGEPRQENGQFLANRPSHFRIELDKYRGVTGRKTMDIFNPALLASIPGILFNGYRSVAYLHSETWGQLDISILKTAGFLGNHGIHYVNEQPRGYFLKYLSQLELLQCYTMFSNNETLATAPPFFTDNYATALVTCNYRRGLGINGNPIDVECFMRERGYIPFDQFHADFKSDVNIGRIVAYCIKCQTRFRLVGVHWNLDYLSGICECKYDADLGITHKNRAFFWTGEKFTRLVPTVAFQRRRWIHNGPIHYDVLMEPSKREYNDSSQYQSIMSPLLFQEHLFSIKKMSKYHKEATLKNSKFIEKILHNSKPNSPQEKVDKTYEPDNLYSLTLELPLSPAWAPNNPKAVSKVEIQPKTKPGQQIVEPITAVVFKMESSYNSRKKQENTTVYCQAQVPESYWSKHLSKEIKLKVTPLPCSNKYDATQNLLADWTTPLYKGGNPLETVMLGKSLEQENWEINPSAISITPEWMKRTNKNLFRDLLNPQQQSCLDTALGCKFSVIHGLPGTGTTYTVAMIALNIHFKENGHILLCAPSNYACNQLGATISKIANNLGIQAPKILRILAQGKEPMGYDQAGMSVLKTELENHDKWLDREEICRLAEVQSLTPDQVSKLIDHAKGNRRDLLSTRQMAVLENHRTEIEEEIMDNSPIIISTVGSLSDYRVKNWASKGKKISAVLIEEAGQLLHPTTLLLGGINTTRMIFAGDQLQLKGPVHSKPAQLGLLDVSLLEAISFQALVVGGENNVPWNTLSIQYRMPPTMYEFVCKITYSGFVPETKECYVEACQEPIIKPWMNYLLDNFDTKRVIVFNHNGHDEKIINSYRNITEVEIISSRVEEFLNHGIKPAQISVITMYELQKRAISDSLERIGIYDVEVNNVDAVQGKENDIVILSLVRSNYNSDIGFLTNVNRLNVAISRAKEFVVIPCNLDFYKGVEIQHFKTFTSLIDGNPEHPSENIAIIV